jgi:MOSC domain-containing protein YiiM
VVELGELQAAVPQVGRLERILLRPGRRATPEDVGRVDAVADRGLAGDRRATRTPRTGPSPRQVTLVQAEHLETVARLLGRDGAIDAALLRRNLVVSGIPLLALKGLRFHIGDAVLEGTGPCHPCSRMEEALGEGGYQAMRGHGGLTATVVASGTIRVGDEVTVPTR